jgi:hypothetical protein
VFKKLTVVAICLTFLCASAMAQDAKTVIANAQKALGDLKSITYLRIGKGCGIPAVRSQRSRHDVPGDARSNAADR